MEALLGSGRSGNTRKRWSTKKEKTMAQPGVSVSSLSLKKTSQKIVQAAMMTRIAAVMTFRLLPVRFPGGVAAESVAEDKRQHDALLEWWKRTVRDPQGHFRRGYQDFATSPEFETKLESVLESCLRSAGLIPSGPAWDIAAKGAPYPGLVPYDGGYSTVFFGRGLAVAEALREIRAAAQRELPALFIVGPSGSGKSSLMRAGIMPAFSGTQIAGVDAWRTVLLEPAQTPLDVLADRLYRKDVLPELASGAQATPRHFVDVARELPQAAAHAVKWALDRAADAMRQRTGTQAPRVHLLLALDQLETLFDSADRKAVAALARALVEDGSTWLIASLRTDRYADLQLDPDFLHLRRGNALFDLPPPGASEISEIIAGPARANGRSGRARGTAAEMAARDQEPGATLRGDTTAPADRAQFRYLVQDQGRWRSAPGRRII